MKNDFLIVTLFVLAFAFTAAAREEDRAFSFRLEANRAFPLPGIGQELVLADLNRDGLQDLFCVFNDPDSRSDGFSLLPGLPGGLLGEPQNFLYSVDPRGGIVQDLNQDGLEDIAFLTRIGSLLVIFENQTEPGQLPFQFHRRALQRVDPPFFESIAAIDADGDGWTDLLLWSRDEPLTAIFRSSASELFPVFERIGDFLPLTEDVFIPDFEAGFFDEDSLPDFITAAGNFPRQHPQLKLYLGDTISPVTSPLFIAAATRPLEATPVALVADRFDSDDKPDTLVVTDYSRGVELWSNQVSMNPETPFLQIDSLRIEPRENIGKILTADFNADGLRDFLDPQPALFLQNVPSDGRFTGFERHEQPGLAGWRFAIGELTGDLEPDLVSALGTQPFVGVFAGKFEQNSPPLFGGDPFCTTASFARTLAAWDWNHDGLDDLAVFSGQSGAATGELIFFSNQGNATFSESLSLSIPGTVEFMQWTEEGHLFVLHSGASNGWRLYRQDVAPPGFSLSASAPVDKSPRDALLEDFDGDGLDDLILIHEESFSTRTPSRITLFQGTGIPTDPWINPITRSLDLPDNRIRPRSPLVRDFNRDGLSDLAILNTLHNQSSDFVILYGDGSLDPNGFVLETHDSGEGRNPVDWLMADIEQDGEEDLVILCRQELVIIPLAAAGVDSPLIFGDISAFPLDSRADFGSVREIDFQGNGSSDLVIGINSIYSILLQQNQSVESAYPPAIHYVGGTKEFDFGDFDGDGRVDLAGADGDRVKVFFNRSEPFDSPTPTPTGTPSPTYTPSPTPTQGLAGDFDSNSSVDPVDLIILVTDWKNPPSLPTQTDLNRDGFIDSKDLFLFQEDWQKSLP
jgi:hypothetical protein